MILDTNKIKEARKTMRDAFLAHPDFEQAYIDNIALLLYDRFDILPWEAKEERDKIAEAVLDLIFRKEVSEEVSHDPS